MKKYLAYIFLGLALIGTIYWARGIERVLISGGLVAIMVFTYIMDNKKC